MSSAPRIIGRIESERSTPCPAEAGDEPLDQDRLTRGRVHSQNLWNNPMRSAYAPKSGAMVRPFRVSAQMRSGGLPTGAVGTRVTPRPPHRPGLAAFPHPVPTLDGDVPGIGAWAAHTAPARGRDSPCDTTARRGVRIVSGCSPSPRPSRLPSTASAAGPSTDLVRRPPRYYACARLLRAVHRRLISLFGFPDAARDRIAVAGDPEISQVPARSLHA